ncbi:Sec-independent protein translocase protein TatB [Alteraurantiacibacter buctensis]|uniref:Sec-independent protein translocase protein TatB n=1 Tax=Alteraurantiacibacter buctensis TaxID=1503981 RepID=A0A844Z090_9SPHN|nr:twin-arginine translocase subunit TatB [Alteraurantiacibacter buctensis]
MFDIGASELLMIAVVAIVVIGPKDMPAALRTAGRWIAKARKMSSHFRTGLDAMIREAEMEDLEKKWKEQNAKIMALYPEGGPAGTEQTGAYPAAPAPTAAAAPAAAPAPTPAITAPAAADAPKQDG